LITDKQVETFWREDTFRNDTWFLVWFFGFISGLVIVAHIFKHVFKVKWKMWLMNDTVDGDYGTDDFIDSVNNKKGWDAFMTLFGLFKMHKGLYSAFWWWWRNKAWNFYTRTVPEWDAGRVDKFRVMKLTIPDIKMYDKGRYNRFKKANKSKGIYGINYYCYQLNGKVFCNYSEATPNKEKQFGAGGNEWRNWTKR